MWHRFRQTDLDLQEARERLKGAQHRLSVFQSLPLDCQLLRVKLKSAKQELERRKLDRSRKLLELARQ